MAVWRVGDVFRKRFQGLRRDGTHAPRSAIGRRAPALGLAFEEAREGFEIARRRAWAVAFETGDAILDVGRVGDLRHLAVADEIDARGDLGGDDIVHGVADDGGELGRVHRLLTLARED